MIATHHKIQYILGISHAYNQTIHNNNRISVYVLSSNQNIIQSIGVLDTIPNNEHIEQHENPNLAKGMGVSIGIPSPSPPLP